MALSCSFRNLCISSGLPAIWLFFEIIFSKSLLFYQVLNDHEQSNCAKPCSKDGKICGKAPECRSRHNAATIVARRLGTSEKRGLKNIGYVKSMDWTFQWCGRFQWGFLFRCHCPATAWRVIQLKKPYIQRYISVIPKNPQECNGLFVHYLAHLYSEGVSLRSCISLI